MNPTRPDPEVVALQAAPTTGPTTPSLRRRLAAMLYEGVMLFGVALVPAVLATVLAQLIGNPAQASWAAQASGLVCFGAYFVWLWTRTGQTLPMQTWRIKLVTADGQPLRWRRALGRYLLCWLWVAPAVLVGMLRGWSRWSMLGAVAAWAAGYALVSLFMRDRQFLHDRLAGTRLVNVPPRPATPN